ncbi:MAG: class I SAM-dependent RNA methyltransferase [Verrucomicrobia bacterium]|nr:class I SAM-dependent RNA methyltransferase [Verrucomicrobiota bacterium]
MQAEAFHLPPPNLGQRYTVTISDIAFGGDGVARVGDFVIFVPFVVLGEEVEVELTEVKKHFARAKLVRVVTPSPLRVEPKCRYFGGCGGCQYQHIDYAEQLRLKRKQVADLMQRLGGFDPQLVQPVKPCPQPYGYRNRLLIRSQWNKPERRLNIGFLRHDCGLVEDIEECAIAEPALNEQIREVRRNPPPKGGIKVSLRIQPEGWEVPPDSFFQNNFFLLPELVNTVRERVRDAGARFLVDAYCGVGFFALELAADVESFAGVEYDRMAIRAARQNARQRGVANGEFIAGDVGEALPGLLEKFDRARTVLILDPPRTGCRPAAIDVLRRAGPAQILHVSCHPATLARDLKALCAEGRYELVRLDALDMFPQTQHVECVADLRLGAEAAATAPAQTNLAGEPAVG